MWWTGVGLGLWGARGTESVARRTARAKAVWTSERNAARPRRSAICSEVLQRYANSLGWAGSNSVQKQVLLTLPAAEALAAQQILRKIQSPRSCRPADVDACPRVSTSPLAQPLTPGQPCQPPLGQVLWPRQQQGDRHLGQRRGWHRRHQGDCERRQGRLGPQVDHPPSLDRPPPREQDRCC